MTGKKKTLPELLISLICTLASRLIGFLRASVEIAAIGLGSLADAWQGSFRLTNFFRELFGEGALGAVFTPVFEHEREKGNAELAYAYAWSLTLCVFLFSSALAFILWLSLKPIILLWLNGMPPEAQIQTIEMTSIMLPYLPCIATGSVFMLYQQMQGRFVLSSLHPMLFSLTIILAALWNPLENLGQSLAVGVSLGGLLQLLLLALSSKMPRIRFQQLPQTWPLIRKTLNLMLPILGALALTRSRALIEAGFASGLPSGNLGALAYAYILLQVPIGIFSIAASNVFLPRLSRLHARQNHNGYAHLLQGGVRILLGLALPVAVYLALYAELVCTFIFIELPSLFTQPVLQSQAELERLATAVEGYAPALVPLILIPLFNRAFHAQLQTRIPALIGGLTVVCQIFFTISLLESHGLWGITTATASAFLIQALIMATILHRAGALRRVGPLLSGLLRCGLLISISLFLVNSMFPEADHVLHPILYAFIYFPIWTLLEWVYDDQWHQSDSTDTAGVSQSTESTITPQSGPDKD